jgi:hypothetical protein
VLLSNGTIACGDSASGTSVVIPSHSQRWLIAQNQR